VDDIASTIGFKNVTTIEDLRHAFPSLDSVDHKRRRGDFFSDVPHSAKRQCPQNLKCVAGLLVIATYTFGRV
jgi:hypothetical protein